MKPFAIAVALVCCLALNAFAQEEGEGLSVEMDRDVEAHSGTSRDVRLFDVEGEDAGETNEDAATVDEMGETSPNGETPAPPLIGEFEGVVTRVLDADLVEIDGERMRLLGVNAPEYQGAHNDCYGLEATKWLENLIQDKKVTYSFDRSYTRRDAHGDTRVYVYHDGTFVNAELVANGMAFVDTSKNYGAREAMTALQVVARRKHKGLWHACPVECGRNGVCRTRNW